MHVNYVDENKPEFTFPSASPNTICPSGSQSMHVIELFCINLATIDFFSPL